MVGFVLKNGRFRFRDYISYFKTTDKIIYFFTFLFNLFWVSMPLASNVFIV
nr:MAG TPA: hypothetical protein [Caudoviricetes sp.]